MKVSILTGGDDPNYAIPLTSTLLAQGVFVDFIGNDDMQNAEIFFDSNSNYLNFRGNQSSNSPLFLKILRIFKYYSLLIIYTARTDSKVFHILWLNKFLFFDRTLLMLYYKLFKKKIIYTAHNINQAERDGNDNLLNRVSLRFLYKVVNHIFVHTNKMKEQLVNEFFVDEDKITVIPFGLNTFVPTTNLTALEAKQKFILQSNQKIILFFGRIANYKGLEHLLFALAKLVKRDKSYRLIIVGKVAEGYTSYWRGIKKILKTNNLQNYIITKMEYIPDEHIEVYFKASDILVLPYNKIFQSGPLFLSYYFGLPVIASDVGSFREDIIEGDTGFIFSAQDPDDLSNKISYYFKSDLYNNLEMNRYRIIKSAKKRYSWEKNGKITHAIYKSLYQL